MPVDRRRRAARSAGLAGRQVPVNGASPDVTHANGSLGRVVEHDLAEVVPAPARRREQRGRRARRAQVSVAVRSPTYVWSMPTVVAPSSSVHSVPSIENVSFDA